MHYNAAYPRAVKGPHIFTEQAPTRFESDPALPHIQAYNIKVEISVKVSVKLW